MLGAGKPACVHILLEILDGLFGVTTCIVILTPGMGDEVQIMKAGILEVADIFAVNKADSGRAEDLKIWLDNAIGMMDRPGGWRPVPGQERVAGTGSTISVSFTAPAPGRLRYQLLTLSPRPGVR